MNEIAELKRDFAFLRKVDSNNKLWEDVIQMPSGNKIAKHNKKSTSNSKAPATNFLLHPKRLSSDSECSSRINSPKRFFSSTIIKSGTLDEDLDTAFSSRKLLSQFTSLKPSQDTILFTDLRQSPPTIEESKSKKRVEIQDVIGMNKREKNTANEESAASGHCNKNPAIKTDAHIEDNRCNKMKGANRPSSFRILNNDKKFNNVVEKNIKLLNDIKELLEKGSPAHDGGEDLLRRERRLQEFSSRFSRTYLYPLVRLMAEMNTASEKISMQTINQKVITAHQVVHQALQAYLNHLPTSVGKCGTDKLKTLLDQVLELCNIYEAVTKKRSSWSESDEFINALKSHTELLGDAIVNFDMKYTEKNPRLKERGGGDNSSFNPPTNKKPRPILKANKFSMYSVTASFRRDADWKRAVEALASKKLSVKSKYRTATFKHRPPPEKPHIVSLPSKAKLFPKKSSGVIKTTTPIRSPLREEDIRTMVEIEQERDEEREVLQVPANSSAALNQHHHEEEDDDDDDEVSVRGGDHHQDLVENSARKGEDHPSETEEDSVRKALKVLGKCLGDENGNDILAKIAKAVDRKIIEKRDSGKNTSTKKTKKEPIVTAITGAKNAKLICILDENSIIESTIGSDNDSCDREDDDVSDRDKRCHKLKSSSTQTDLLRNCGSNKSSSIKISRLPKGKRGPLKSLPKDHAINCIQYKLQYSNFRKHNPMYRKSTTVQPWILMGRIADQVLDQIIESVVGEMEINELLENLYNAEFQY